MANADLRRRHFTRVPLEAKAIIRYEEREIDGELENLSLKGMFIRTYEKIRVNEVVEVEIFLTGASSHLAIRFSAIVRRHGDEGMGKQIKDIDFDSFIHLRNVVSYNTGDSDAVRAEFHDFLKTIG